MTNIVYPQGRVKVTVPATGSIAVASFGLSSASVYRELGFPNEPPALSLLGSVSNAETVYGPYTSGATIIIEAGADQVQYDYGLTPRVTRAIGSFNLQNSPSTLNATGTLTSTMMLNGIVTSTTAAAVAATLDTGAIMDDATSMSVGDSFDWTIINTGGNTLTVTASTGHTIVGTATVVTVVSAQFRTRKTAADTFVTYRLS